MTDDVKEIPRRAESWPEDDQAELVNLARLIEARRSGVYRLSDDERAAVRKGVEAARRGEFAADEEIERFYQLHRSA
jgi:predicted transcriptional regulator